MVENAKITPGAADAREVGRRCRPRSTIPSRGRSTTTSTTVKQLAARTTIRTWPATPARCSGATQRARAATAVSGRAEDLHDVRPGTAVHGATRRSPTSSRRIRRSSPRRSSSIDNTDGGVRAIAIGRGFDAEPVRPRDRGPGRQAGSSFKTFTLAAALSQRLLARTTGVDGAAALAARAGHDQTRSTTSRGDCSRRTIDAHPTRSPISDNCAFVRTELSLGPGQLRRTTACRSVIDMAPHDGHRHVELPTRVVSTTLGTQGVQPARDGAGVLGARRTTAC